MDDGEADGGIRLEEREETSCSEPQDPSPLEGVGFRDPGNVRVFVLERLFRLGQETPAPDLAAGRAGCKRADGRGVDSAAKREQVSAGGMEVPLQRLQKQCSKLRGMLDHRGRSWARHPFRLRIPVAPEPE